MATAAVEAIVTETVDSVMVGVLAVGWAVGGFANGVSVEDAVLSSMEFGLKEMAAGEEA